MGKDGIPKEWDDTILGTTWYCIIWDIEQVTGIISVHGEQHEASMCTLCLDACVLHLYINKAWP